MRPSGQQPNAGHATSNIAAAVIGHHLRISVGFVRRAGIGLLNGANFAIARRALEKMLPRGVSHRAFTPGERAENLARWTTRSRRIRVRAAQN
jgi:hypothetical protein